MEARNQFDVLAHEESPLDHAVAQRDKTSVSMVDAALRHDEAMLAFQPIVTSSKPHTIVFYEGLIRIPDQPGALFRLVSSSTRLKNLKLAGLSIVKLWK